MIHALILPDWLPNLHPLVIHFPIAFLALAVVLDLVRQIYLQAQWVNNTVILSYILGTVGLIIAFITGRSAAETVDVSGEAFSVLASHENWALAAMIFFLVFTSIRVLAAWSNYDLQRLPALGLVCLGLVGMGLVWVTGDRGGELVFRHGAGVAAVEELQQELAQLEEELETIHGAAAPQLADDGSWRWRIAPGSEQILGDAFHWLKGSPEDAGFELTEDEDGNHVLGIEARGSELMFLLQHEIEAVEGRFLINSDDFDGSVSLVHNVLDANTYQYLKLENETISQGQMIDREDDMLGDNSVGTSGWKEVRVQASGGHFYGHIDGEQRVHTHAPQMDPGYTGLLIEGSGTLYIQRVSFDALD